MDSISIQSFEKGFKDWIKKAIDNHNPLKVNDDNGQDFIIISAEDWEREQETLYILQNSDLMKQIAASMETHIKGQGYLANSEEINEILSI
jgi:antitoxin YefM